MNIDFNKLEEFLKTLKHKDFEENKKILESHTIDDIKRFGLDKKVLPEQIINYGDYFIVDILGNDLTVVKLTKKKHKTPNGRLLNLKIVKTIIYNCKKQYGYCLNGCWAIPKNFN